MRLAVICLFLCTSTFFPAQNIVLNPGFETKGKAAYPTLSFDFFQLFAVNNWITPTLGTSDYFFRGKNGFNFLLDEYGGAVDTCEGIAFAGIIPWMEGREYREYLQGELAEKPEAGKSYTFSMKVATGNGCDHFVEELGVYFSPARLIDMDRLSTLDRVPQVKLDISSFAENPDGWATVCGTFVAQGNEKYFTLGNFNTDAATPVRTREGFPQAHEWCYYYIDAVSLVLGNVPCDPPTAFQQSFRPGKTFVTRDIRFDTDRSTIKAESYVSLYAILAELKKQPALKVEVLGHTDSTGSTAHNQQLSEARAKAVAEFLISNGVPKENISWKGFGSSQPVSATDNAMNRRVEFVFRE